jgi:hypothetical protein
MHGNAEGADQFGRFAEDFVEYRRRELERFLQRVASHQRLIASAELKVFLQAGADEWAQAKAQGLQFDDDEREKPESKSGFGRIGSFLNKKVQDYQAGGFAALTGTYVEIDNGFAEKQRFFNALENELSRLIAATELLVSSRQCMPMLYASCSMLSLTLVLFVLTKRLSIDSDVWRVPSCRRVRRR